MSSINYNGSHFAPFYKTLVPSSFMVLLQSQIFTMTTTNLTELLAMILDETKQDFINTNLVKASVIIHEGEDVLFKKVSR